MARKALSFNYYDDSTMNVNHFIRLANAETIHGRDFFAAEEAFAAAGQMSIDESFARRMARRYGTWARRSVRFAVDMAPFGRESVFDPAEDARKAAHYARKAQSLADERESLRRAAARVIRRWRRSLRAA